MDVPLLLGHQIGRYNQLLSLSNAQHKGCPNVSKQSTKELKRLRKAACDQH
jgi:hypothetical protein